MYNRVSPELRDKIEKDFQEVFDDDGNEIGIITFTSEERALYLECIEWKDIINLHFSSSYSGGALKNFLQYEYIRPHEILSYTVTFTYEINWNPTWRDWFVVKEDPGCIFLSC